jgi:AcrR family transcriptional regulator
VLNEDPFARRKILLVAAAIIKENGSKGVSFDYVAQRADLEVTVIEELFDSRTQLIAEVQMANYFVTVEPIHLVLSRIETAVADGDEAAFWEGIEENLVMSWSASHFENKWGIINLLNDVWSDPFTQSHFCDLLDIQFHRWIMVVEGAKSNGWVDETIDAKAVTAVFWSASIGQVITAGSTSLELSPNVIRDFFVQITKKKVQHSTLLASSPTSEASL